MDMVERHLNCGNFYINRNIVGAVVGVQPFGGHGLSGTGPKAGGEFYLQRLTRTPRYYSQFGDENTLGTTKPILESITGEHNSLAYLPCEVAILMVTYLRQKEPLRNCLPKVLAFWWNQSIH